jgi:hypothetical protein
VGRDSSAPEEERLVMGGSRCWRRRRYGHRITLSIDRPKLTPEEEKKLMAAERNNRVSERRSSDRP